MRYSLGAVGAGSTGDAHTTKGEKVLAFVLAVFLLIGGVWAYHRLDRRDHAYARAPISAADAATLARYERLQRDAGRAASREAELRDSLELAREAYRTELDAGHPAPRLERAYRNADAAHSRSLADPAIAQRKADAARPAAEAVSKRQVQAQKARIAAAARTTFLLRLGLVLAALAGAFAAFALLRASRYLPLGSAAVSAATILALVMSGDYVQDYVEWRRLGPFVISLAGIGLSLMAFWGLQRYLTRRLPLRRVRKGECPVCGFPVRSNARCEGCGRAVVTTCAACHSPRRVGAIHCGSCGAT